MAERPPTPSAIVALEQQRHVKEPSPEPWSFRVWPQLPPELAERIVGCLGRNDIAGTFRHLNKATVEHFSGPQHTLIRLSEPVPPHAFAAHWLTLGATRGLTLERRKDLVRLVAASGVLQTVELALQAAGFVGAVVVAFKAAAGAGQLPMCQWLWDHSSSRTEDPLDARSAEDALDAAAGGGHRHVCEWLLAIKTHQLRTGPVYAALRGGHADLAEWLLQQGPTLPIDDTHVYLCSMVYGCDLPTLQRAWLHFGTSLLGLDTKAAVLSSAAGSPTPDWAAKVEWLEAQGCPRSIEAAREAAGLPDHSKALARLTWLLGRGYPANWGAVRAAVRNGNTSLLLHLLEEVPVGNVFEREEMMFRAVRGGHLAALQALYAAGWPTYRAFSLLAARHGHLHVLAWLLDTLGPAAVVLNAEFFAAAAESGNMELLAWLRQHGCLWDCGAYSGAVGSGCAAVLEWLAEQGCPMEESGQPYIRACRNGDLATARCLRRLGVPWGPDGRVFLAAAWEDFNPAPPPLLRWLLEEGCPEVVEEGLVGGEFLRLLGEDLGSG
ncbi:hypothetical protein GPECTOR_47g340 [Gonium pectorale]|uniref:Uncharacterized protein n=1 Tax=Gonium pectorale TaxID=33097 RepID=A0A150G936_GONPE|nr:hypothetical protein GPECTOR_47g340 [Gonium pectorale]|eukprot:KXZ46065.1 hypothetical protein GPECTOR_47g340 [Gonium pectorale]